MVETDTPRWTNRSAQPKPDAAAERTYRTPAHAPGGREIRPISSIMPKDDAEADDGAQGALDENPAVGTMVDVTSLLILSATAAAPKTVRDLAVELNLPIASLYRRVRALQSAGVLGAHKRKDRATGKETMVYEGLVSGLKISFGATSPVIEVAYRADDSHE